MLREAVTNLIDNACRHGGPRLSHIAVEVTPDAIVRVSDDGCGIPEEELGRVTKRFVQLNESGSTGLGLALVDAIAVGHGGGLRMVARDQGVCAELKLTGGVT